MNQLLAAFIDKKKCLIRYGTLALYGPGKLGLCGVQPNALVWFAVYPARRSLRVQVESILSHSRRITAGVLQGSHLGLILFTVFINDLPAAVPSSTSLYTVDALHSVYSIFSSARSAADHRFFQDGTLFASFWASSWQGHFSPSLPPSSLLPPPPTSHHADWHNLHRQHGN